MAPVLSPSVAPPNPKVGTSRLVFPILRRRIWITKRALSSRSGLDGQAINPSCRPAEQGSFLLVRRAFSDALKGVPQHGIAACTLIDWKIAFEHAAFRSERLDAGLNVGSPGSG